MDWLSIDPSAELHGIGKHPPGNWEGVARLGWLGVNQVDRYREDTDGPAECRQSARRTVRHAGCGDSLRLRTQHHAPIVMIKGRDLFNLGDGPC